MALKTSEFELHILQRKLCVL